MFGDFWMFRFRKIKIALIISAIFIVCQVELEGFEPSSKQGTQELSTCLSFGQSFCRDLVEGDPAMTPACKFRDSFQAPEPLSQFWWYPVCLLTTGRSLRRGTRPSASLDRGIKPFYLVKLSSECVAIIAICSLSVHFNEPPHNARHAYNQTLPAVKTGQPLYCILTKIMFFVRITK